MSRRKLVLFQRLQPVRARQTCAINPTTSSPDLATSNDNDEPFEEGFNDAVSASVVRIMSKIPTRLIRQLLRIFDVRLNSYTPRMLATALSEQLHYETDSDFEEEA